MDPAQARALGELYKAYNSGGYMMMDPCCGDSPELAELKEITKKLTSASLNDAKFQETATAFSEAATKLTDLASKVDAVRVLAETAARDAKTASDTVQEFFVTDHGQKLRQAVARVISNTTLPADFGDDLVVKPKGTDATGYAPSGMAPPPSSSGMAPPPSSSGYQPSYGRPYY